MSKPFWFQNKTKSLTDSNLNTVLRLISTVCTANKRRTSKCSFNYNRYHILLSVKPTYICNLHADNKTLKILLVFIIYHYDIHSIICHYIWFIENKNLCFIFNLKQNMTSFWHLILFIFLTLKEVPPSFMHHTYKLRNKRHGLLEEIRYYNRNIKINVIRQIKQNCYFPMHNLHKCKVCPIPRNEIELSNMGERAIKSHA